MLTELGTAPFSHALSAWAMLHDLSCLSSNKPLPQGSNFSVKTHADYIFLVFTMAYPAASNKNPCRDFVDGFEDVLPS